MKEHITSHGNSDPCAEGGGAGEPVGEFRAILPCGRDRDADRDDGSRTRWPPAARVMSGARAARRTAGVGRRARSAFTAARSRSSAYAFAGSTAGNTCLPSWKARWERICSAEWAMNQMLINVSTRKFKRSVRLPEGDVPAADGAGLSKSATSRRFVALSAARMKEWMSTRLDDLDLLVIQIDGSIWPRTCSSWRRSASTQTGDKHPLGLVEGATENATTVQALIDNLIDRGLDPAVRRLFIIDGSKALSKAIKRTFGRDTPIQRCQIHKARNILERLPKSMHASVRSVLRQAWEMDDAAQGRKAAAQPRSPSRTPTGRALPPRSWKGWTRCSPSRGSVFRANCAARWPARTSSRMSWARCVVFAGTSNIGAPPRWRCAGPPPRCRKRPRAFERLKAYKQLPALRAALDKTNPRAATAEPLAQIAEAA